jgi:hypothetical protein
MNSEMKSVLGNCRYAQLVFPAPLGPPIMTAFFLRSLDMGLRRQVRHHGIEHRKA